MKNLGKIPIPNFVDALYIHGRVGFNSGHRNVCRWTPPPGMPGYCKTSEIKDLHPGEYVEARCRDGRWIGAGAAGMPIY